MLGQGVYIEIWLPRAMATNGDNFVNSMFLLVGVLANVIIEQTAAKQ
jgi:hypothetical protein